MECAKTGSQSSQELVCALLRLEANPPESVLRLVANPPKTGSQSCEVSQRERVKLEYAASSQ